MHSQPGASASAGTASSSSRYSGGQQQYHQQQAGGSSSRPPLPSPFQGQQHHDPRNSSVYSDDGQQSGDDDENDHGNDQELPNGKRKRPLSVSCETCKTRKVKCDRGQPSCGWCTRNAHACEYKERKKPGLRAGYGRELEQRLDHLEGELRKHAEILAAHGLDINSTRTPGSVNSPATLNSNTTTRNNHVSSSHRSNPSLQSNDHGTPREVGPPPVFAHAGPDSAERALFMHKPSTSADYGLGPRTPAVVHDNFQHATTTQPHIQPAMTPSAAIHEYYSAPKAAPHQIPSVLPATQGQGGTEQELPPYGVCYALMELYFKHIHPWCPILDRETTKDLFFGERIPNEEEKILLHAIVATAMRFATNKNLPQESRQRFYNSSKQRVLLYGMEHSSVMSLQALVILALDLCGSSNGPPGWNIMALITRGVVQLGLAVETNSMTVSPSYPSIYTLRAMVLPEPRDFAEEESRRRLFWMVYVLDRYATISTAFDFALDDKEIDRTLPCRDELWIKNQKVETRWFHTADDDSRLNSYTTADYQVNKPENLGAFSHYIEILGILSNIHKFLKQPVDISSLTDVETWQARYRQLDNMLKMWKFELPDEYTHMAKIYDHPRVARSLSCTWIMLHATYHTAVIRLHSSAAYPTVRSPIFAPSFLASQTCRDAVNNILALGKFVVEYNFLSTLGPPFAFTLWVAARVLLVHGSTVERRLNYPDIQFFVDTLRKMGEYWPVATRYSNLLTRVLDEYKASVSEGDEVTPSSMRILADMRRTAFDLDLLISRQPRHRVRQQQQQQQQQQQHGHGHGHSTNAGGTNMINAGVMTPVMNHNANGQQFSVGPTPLPPPPGGTGPHDLEYLDVFDFFNMPRFPLSAIGPTAQAQIQAQAQNEINNQNHQDHNNLAVGDRRILPDNGETTISSSKHLGQGQQGINSDTLQGPEQGIGVGGEFNIMDFTVYPERDWLGNSRGSSGWVDGATGGIGAGSGAGARPEQETTTGRGGGPGTNTNTSTRKTTRTAESSSAGAGAGTSGGNAAEGG
ncbi:fungal-specific transcription factor domain-containing protein [Sordaria brevicollis]|uniref:Fungal-specific transcription factor domain-containing protein n=1 Tax=Sordaria brevicollis TaxID=83679 RepID=A0AAE0NVM0_SORBR|nr:fungal-specific transcription factor domain-containing protein [Sordaria brevicollis]